MKRFRNLVIGGIETKLFNLILITVLLISAAFSAVMLYQSSMLTRLTDSTGEKQRESIAVITDSVMDQVVVQNMDRATQLEAYIADEMFHGLETRVGMLGEYAGKLFSDPDGYPEMPYAEPDPGRDGEVTSQLILADGVDGNARALSSGLGLIANMSDMMVSLFGASAETNSCFIALPEGAFLVVDDRSASKFDEEGKRISYDPRTRPWYQQAVAKGSLIFTDVEIDAFTGDIGIVCAMPVYTEGRLSAVVGSDLFLTSMQDYIQGSDENGGFQCVVNQYGHVVFSPKTEGTFRVISSSEAEDLRNSGNREFGALVSDALKGKTDVRLIELDGSRYYMVGVPMDTVGWSLISVFDAEMAAQPGRMLQESYRQTEEEAKAYYRDQAGHSKWTILILLLLFTCLTLAGALMLGKRIVKPLNSITARIRRLKEGDLEFRMEDEYRTGDEIEILAESFASISHKTVEYIEEVKRVTAEKERIGTELQMATRIQSAMLPHIFPAFPDRPELDIYASMDPAKEVGGDFYDYFLIDDDHLCMVMADVSGKGVPAALFMMASKIIIQSSAMLGLSASEILTRTNAAVCSNNEEEMFVTVWIGILELSTGKLTASNAGHEYPVLKNPGWPFERIRDAHGFVIGCFDDVQYKEYELVLEPGSKLFVYTDGVPEATNAAKELFGAERMVAALNEDAEADPVQLLKNVRRAVDGFVQNAEQFDDLTMMCLEYKGKQ
ncbi:MAG: SpoIIE family protein phosphatase [Lachnospiraceae bacterium]|nr:SpoIIE family protein phosphatase [Lachnospiraceae bacterium]